jgi:hypothetical protein
VIDSIPHFFPLSRLVSKLFFDEKKFVNYFLSTIIIHSHVTEVSLWQGSEPAQKGFAEKGAFAAYK